MTVGPGRTGSQQISDSWHYDTILWQSGHVLDSGILAVRFLFIYCATEFIK